MVSHVLTLKTEYMVTFFMFVIQSESCYIFVIQSESCYIFVIQSESCYILMIQKAKQAYTHWSTFTSICGVYDDLRVFTLIYWRQKMAATSK